MFGPSSRNLTQVLTYWAPGSMDGYGAKGFAAPVLIKGRWTEAAEEVTVPGGQVIVSKAVVNVDRDVIVTGYLAQGSHLAEPNPHAVEGAEKIQQFLSAPDLRFMDQNRRAYL